MKNNKITISKETGFGVFVFFDLLEIPFWAFLSKKLIDFMLNY